jgi:hypothetical protein
MMEKKKKHKTNPPYPIVFFSSAHPKKMALMIHELPAEFDTKQLMVYKPNQYESMRITYGRDPMYIRVPACRFRNGIVKAASRGKKQTAELMFIDTEAMIMLEFTAWLETALKQKLGENGEQWFSPSLDSDDIEQSFCPILRSKTEQAGAGGTSARKSQIMKVDVFRDAKMFSESGAELSFDQLTSDSNTVCCIEIVGMKCIQNRFLLDAEIKQIMIVSPKENPFESLLIKPALDKAAPSPPSLEDKAVEPVELEVSVAATTTTKVPDDDDDEMVPVVLGAGGMVDTVLPSPKEEPDKKEPQPDKKEPQPPSTMDDDEDMVPVNITIENQQTVDIKSRHDVYFDMWQEAIRKAKIARDLTISLYMEAEKIRNSHLLNDVLKEENTNELSFFQQVDSLEEKELKSGGKSDDADEQ